MMLFNRIYPAELEHYNYDHRESGMDLYRRIEKL